MNYYCLRVAALAWSAGLGFAAEPGSLSAPEMAMHAPVALPDHRVGVRFWPQRESSSAVIVPRSLPPPAYPAELLCTAVNGFATLEFVIGNDGVVRDVRADADSVAAFVPAAVAAVRNWTFQPVVDHKTSAPVTARMRCQFSFTSYRDDDGVPGLMSPFARTRLTGREVVDLAERAVRKQGIDLAKYPGAFTPSPNTLYPNITIHQARDGRTKWFIKWSRRIDDTHWENLPVWIDDQSRVAHVNDAPSEWKEMPDADYAVAVLFRLEQGSTEAVVPASLPPPAYPFDLARAGIGGRVEVAFVINPEGGIADAKLVKSSQREFEAPVRDVITQWRFRPTGGRSPNAAGVKTTAYIIFQKHPDDRWDSAVHMPAFVLARLSGHDVARLAVAKANEQGVDMPLLREPTVHIFGTREGVGATREGSVRWLIDDFLPNTHLWIDDASGLVRVEPKSSYTFVLLRDVPAEILAIAMSTAVANVGALAEFEAPETRLDTVKSMWILSFRRRSTAIPWAGPAFSVFVDAKTHAARFQAGGISGR